MRVLLIIGFLVLCGCTPATISRIGPPLDPRSADCDVELLEEGEKPSRPYRDVGMVTLENCQDYTTRPCVTWLNEAACQLGGSVAYLPEEQRPTSDMVVAPMTFRVMVAVYVADLITTRDDAVLNSRKCDPPCGAGKRCGNLECVSADADCGEPSKKEEEPADKCLE